MQRQQQQQQQRQLRRKRWALLIGVLLAVVLLVVVVNALRRLGKPTQASATRLPCLAGQQVTPFGEYVLYYDGVSIWCITTSGSVRWSYQIGEGASFAVSDTSVVAWAGGQMCILDQDGNSSYDDNLRQPVQFASIGKKYAAAIIGDDTEPRLLIRDMNGVPVDEEAEAFAGRMMLAVGFYGSDGQYIWTLSLDALGTAANYVLNTFEVGQMNTGVISLGEPMAYRVLYDNQNLRVVTSRQLRSFNYQGVESAQDAILVFGWRLIASETPERGDTLMILAPENQTGSQYSIREVRLLSGKTDRRYTLPSACVGATVYQKTMYAFSSDYIYRTDMSTQRFAALNRPQNMEGPMTDFLGITKNGEALVASGDTVYAVDMP
jgi:hypothetical protein